MRTPSVAKNGLSLARNGLTQTGFSLRDILHLVGAVLQRQRGRSRLAALDAHLLRDIGLTAEAAATEATKPIWRA